MEHIARCKHEKFLAVCDVCYPKDQLLESWKEAYYKMDKQHKWHKEIKAWADGAEIEFRVTDKCEWETLGKNFIWSDGCTEYRIKPQPKEPKYLYVTDGMKGIEFHREKQYQENPAQYNIGKIKLEQDE